MVDKNLFIYLTRSSGHDLGDAAEAMGMTRSQLSRRLSGEIPFRDNEMASWMALVGCTNAGPVFFPHLCAGQDPHNGVVP